MRGICSCGGRAFPDYVVYTYEETANDAARFFLRNVLKIDDTDHFDGLDLRINASLARDLVEYKRELNKATSLVDQRMSDFVCAELERVVTDDGRYRDFLSPEVEGEAVARRRGRQRNAQPGFRHDAISASHRAKCQRLEVLSWSFARAGERAERASQQDQVERGISARTGDSATAPGYPPVPRDVRFDRFRARLARIETRSATSLEAILASGWDAPPSPHVAFVAASRFRILFADPTHFWKPIPCYIYRVSLVYI